MSSVPRRVHINNFLTESTRLFPRTRRDNSDARSEGRTQSPSARTRIRVKISHDLRGPPSGSGGGGAPSPRGARGHGDRRARGRAFAVPSLRARPSLTHETFFLSLSQRKEEDARDADASEERAPPLRQVLLPVDGTAQSEYMVDWALANFCREGDQVNILHVIPK